jgi:hypothetical protein
LATSPIEQEDDLAAVFVLQAVLASVEQAALSLEQQSPACNELIVAKAATVKQTSSFFMVM